MIGIVRLWMGVPGPGTIGQMVPGTRDHHTWDQDHWLNFLWDQGPKPQDIWDQGPLDNIASWRIIRDLEDWCIIMIKIMIMMNAASVHPFSGLVVIISPWSSLESSGIFVNIFSVSKPFFAPNQCRQRPKNTYGVLPFWRKLRLAPAYADVWICARDNSQKWWNRYSLFCSYCIVCWCKHRKIPITAIILFWFSCW